MPLNKLFYYLKPFIPRVLQIALRRQIALRKRRLYRHTWPIDSNSAKLPEGWSGWPDRKRFAVVLTHDVDTQAGQDKCIELAKLEKAIGFRSSYNFVPERYNVSSDLRHYLVGNGFEVGVHGLYHDGKLYTSRKIFQERANRINFYLSDWGSVGFRSPAMHHNLEWIHDLDIEYDASTFDTDPFEPQSDGVGTIFPFWVQRNFTREGYIELPYTLAQDFTLFVILREKNIDIWMEKLDWIADRGGMVLLNTHPDYMRFSGKEKSIETYPFSYYTKLLEYILSEYKGQYWNILPKDMARYWVKGIVNEKTSGKKGGSL